MTAPPPAGDPTAPLPDNEISRQQNRRLNRDMASLLRSLQHALTAQGIKHDALWEYTAIALSAMLVSLVNVHEINVPGLAKIAAKARRLDDN